MTSIREKKAVQHKWKEGAVAAVREALEKGGEPDQLFGEEFAAKFDQTAMIAIQSGNVLPESVKDLIAGIYTPAEALGLCTSEPECVGYSYFAPDVENNDAGKTEVWFKKQMGEVPGLMLAKNWTTYLKEDTSRKSAPSFVFASGDEVQATTRFGLVGMGASAFDDLVQWPSIQIREKTTGGDWIAKWFRLKNKMQDPSEDTFLPLGTIVHAWQGCQKLVPMLLTRKETVCYLVESDYRGDSLVRELHYAM